MNILGYDLFGIGSDTASCAGAPSLANIVIQNGVFDGVYVCPAGVAHTKTDAEILANYKKVGSFPADDFWIGDIGFDPETCVTYPATQGSGDKTGVGDRVYGGGNASKNTMREYLQGGSFWAGSNAGASSVACGAGLGGRAWDSLAAD